MVTDSAVVSPGGITLKSGRRGFAVYRDGKRLSPSTPIHLRAGTITGRESD